LITTEVNMYARHLVFTWIAATIFTGSVLASEPASDPKAEKREQAAPRSLTLIQRDVHAALREEALSRRRGPNVTEVLRLVDLYREMASHPKRETSAFLAELGLKVRARLANVCDDIERKNANGKKHTKEKADGPADVAPENAVLAQQVGGGAPGQGLGGQPAGGRPGVPPSFDYGPELVEIIQAVISPKTWDINGGPGAVVYYAPLRVLVVSAPDDVHPQIGDLLGQMRAAP
jgi:hypothetical protein